MEILLVNKNRRNDNNNKKGEIYLKWNYKVDRSNSINNMTRNHTHTHTVHSRRHCLLLNWMRRNMCTGLWAHRIIIRNLSSSILERRKKRKVVFFFPFVLSFFFCFLSTFLVLLLLLFLWRRIPVNGAIKSLISRPAYRALQAFLFVLFWNSYLKTKSYSPYFVRVLGFFSPPCFFGPDIYDGIQSSFVLGEASEQGNII